MGLPWGYHGVTMVTKALVDICEQEREKAKQHFELEVKDLMGSLVWVNHGKSAEVQYSRPVLWTSPETMVMGVMAHGPCRRRLMVK